MDFHKAICGIALLVAASQAHAAGAAKQVSSPAASFNQNAASSDIGQRIENASPGNGQNNTTSRPLLVKIQVLLGRAHFSPGEIDGRYGKNLRAAVVAYKQANGLPNPDEIDTALADSLTRNGRAPVLQNYTITQEDETGPFIGSVPHDFRKLAALNAPAYGNPQEELAEKFHMSPELLRELNPQADFSAAGTTLIVAQPATSPLPSVARIEVDKSTNQVRAYGEDGNLAAMFPATVGSTELPAPSGTAEVVYVSHNPAYHYDPSKLHFGPKHAGRLTIKPGPNNPVGTTWIALNRSGYGIHGSPDPDLVGKTASHGCVRLTNWDAEVLGRAVRKGIPVDFVGKTPPTRTASRA
ncbi:MAG TPA: L,D-transpeptidase [Rhizomicrobium sp.]|nr:L,D-transpeptidase [Rhizomicrobium sp.]